LGKIVGFKTHTFGKIVRFKTQALGKIIGFNTHSLDKITRFKIRLSKYMDENMTTRRCK